MAGCKRWVEIDWELKMRIRFLWVYSYKIFNFQIFIHVYIQRKLSQKYFKYKQKHWTQTKLSDLALYEIDNITTKKKLLIQTTFEHGSLTIHP